ncbi:MAG: type II and III secretion system protein [Balneolaceae bacterium]|nr:type II and III secretion system protein [Balneolaceae bacterium]
MKIQQLYHLRKLKIAIIAVLSFLCMPVMVNAQDEYPREYTNPDEIVAFDRSTSYEEAIEVINQFYQEFQNKFIIDQTETTGSIGVTLPAMHWKDALDFILRLKNLTLIESDEFVEIVPLSSLATPEEQQQTQAQQGEINLDTREIRINATFFEGNRRALQEIGVDWSTLRGTVPTELNNIVGGEGAGAGEGLPNTTFNDQFVSINSFNAANVSQNVFNALVNLGPFGEGDNAISVQALFNAFEADNLGEVLATPFTKVLDGEEGRVQVGQDFSIKQRDIAGNVTDQFFSTGTILTVVPTVIDVNDTSFIHLEIEVERSSAQPDAVSTIINKQQASTQALLLDGEATTIAGLYRTEESKVRRGIPILKDLPPWFFGLRYLFGYNSNDYLENELIIIVQASLEKTVKQRANEKFATKQTLLDAERDYLRSNLDAVFNNNLLTTPVKLLEDLDDFVSNENQEMKTEPSKTSEEAPVESPDTSTDNTEGDSEDEMPEEVVDEADTVNNENESSEGNELTPEQQRLADELSMPVENPELMVLVPRAFSLNEYLEQQQNGGEEQESYESEDKRFFVIGGSFIVRNNANRFNESLMDEGYDTRILFHPESRFNYVAYQGFATFDEAVSYLMSIRETVNQEAWLFTLPK